MRQNQYLYLSSADVNGYIELGNLYLKLGDSRSAVNEFKGALRLNQGWKDLEVFIRDLEEKLYLVIVLLNNIIKKL